MSGDSAADAAAEAKMKGLNKYFNAVTVRGRANVAAATYASLACIGLYFYLKPKKASKTAAA